ncbi:MAG: methyltransferase domain-containing protein [Planctomycetaceae bacterium]
MNGSSKQLLNANELRDSPIGANCRMNRERQLTGSNGYERDLAFDLLEFVTNIAATRPVTWLDLCCGSGRALVEAAAMLKQRPPSERVSIEGIDLAGLFVPNPHEDVLSLRVEPIEDWQPQGPYDLITCVHGLHYVGDKLAAIAKGASRLSASGRFLANLDLKNIRLSDGRPAARIIAAELRRNGLTYDSRRRIVGCLGPRTVAFELQYMGADDSAGPNYTGQPAVDSCYQRCC